MQAVRISVTRELCIFFVMLLLGISEGVIFDIFRMFRKKLPRGFLPAGISDIIYWLFAAGCFFYALWNLTAGELRGYMFIGIALGLIFYFLLLSKTIIFVFTAIFKFFLTIFKLIFKILLTPLAFLYKMLLEPFGRLFKRLFICRKKFHIQKRGIKK